MTYYQIEAFLSILDSNSLSKASEELHITQSALSRRIASLENELGYQLIVRQQGKHSVYPTKKGEAFIPVALQWQALWKLTKSIKNYEGPITFTVTAADGPNTYVFHSTFRRFVTEHPNVILNIKTAKSLIAYNELSQNRADLIFVVIPQYSDQFVTKSIYQEEMWLVCNQDAPFSDITVPNSALNPNYFIHCNRPLEWELWFDKWFGNQNPPRIHCDQIALISHFIEDNVNAWSLIPASIAVPMTENRRVSIKKIENPPPHRTVYCAYKKGHIVQEQLVEAFIGILKEELNKNIGVTIL